MSCAIAVSLASRTADAVDKLNGRVSQLAPETTREELAECFAAHHATLVSLLPERIRRAKIFKAFGEGP